MNSDNDRMFELDDAVEWLKQERSIPVTSNLLRAYIRKGILPAQRSARRGRPWVIKEEDLRALHVPKHAMRQRHDEQRICRVCGMKEGQQREDGSIVTFWAYIRVGKGYKRGISRDTRCTRCLGQQQMARYHQQKAQGVLPKKKKKKPPFIPPPGWLTAGQAAKSLFVSKAYILEHRDEFETMEIDGHLLVSEKSITPPANWRTVAQFANQLGISRQAIYESLDRYNVQRWHGKLYIVEKTMQPSLDNLEWLKTMIEYGASPERIAESIGGVSALQVWRALQKHGIDVPRPLKRSYHPEAKLVDDVPCPPNPLESPDWLRSMFLERRRSKAYLAKMANVSVNEVSRALQKYGIVRNTGARAARLASPAPATDSAHVENASFLPPDPAPATDSAHVHNTSSLPSSAAYRLSIFRIIGQAVARPELLTGKDVPVSEVVILDPGSPQGLYYILRLSGEEMVQRGAWIRTGDFVYAEGRIVFDTGEDGIVTLRINARRIGRAPRPWLLSDGTLVGKMLYVTPDWLMIRDGVQSVSVRIPPSLWATLSAWETRGELHDGERIIVQAGDHDRAEWLTDGVLVTINAATYDPTPRLLNSLALVATMKYEPRVFTDKEQRLVWRAILTWQERGTRSAVAFAWGDIAKKAQRTIRKGDTIFVEGKITLSTWHDRNDGRLRSRIEIHTRHVTAAVETDEQVRRAVDRIMRWGDNNAAVVALSEALWL